MPCTNPIHAWQPNEYTAKGKMAPVFKLEKGNKYEPIQLPCQKCAGCRADQKRDWGVRCYHEAQLHSQSSFITLTYETSPPAISKPDIQLFLKRMRDHYGHLRYFATGEYGDRTRRPHYHMLVFGHDFLGSRHVATINEERYINLNVQKIWGHGQIEISNLTPERCFYTAGYCMKKTGQKDTFSLQSRVPPIGKQWLEQHWDNLLRLGHVVIDGHINPIPHVYFKWMEQQLEPVRLKRRQHVAKLGLQHQYKKLKAGESRQLNVAARNKTEGNTL
nr:MAG: replication initiator protein [Microvirus sp.]